ncbi:MAG: DNA-binding response regulator [Gracilimonas sp.]|uniref:response regulator transcription factor n=1 Tax=Gracilimonas sp. TaxID=1974203 RepID=UPI0037537427|nr:DNA-binding response regulator [Gracilimonas sp.]
MKDLRVLILDDEMVIARDVERIIRTMGIKKIRIANDAAEAEAVAHRFLPNLLLSDINLEENATDGIEASKAISRFLNVHVIYITAHSDAGILQRAKESRPQNYIVKPFEEDQIRVAIELAANDPSIKYTGEIKSNGVASLTASEKRIIQLISENNTTKKIAEKLFISPKTVENHRANIMRKLNLKSKNNRLLTWAIENRDRL